MPTDLNTFPGYVKPIQMLVDAGVLYEGATPVGLGATQGGFSWEPGAEIRHPEVDGLTNEMAGLHRVVDYSKNQLSGKFFDVTSGMLKRYAPGATVTGTGTEVITPIDASVFFPTETGASAYMENLVFVGRLQDGSVAHIEMAFAVFTSYKLTTTPKGEALVEGTIKAVLGPAETNLNKCPYVYKVIAPPVGP